MRIAIIVPVLNEAAGVEAALQRLAPLRLRGASVIVVDGGSRDDTVTRATPLADRVLSTSRGRALQMNAGARTPEAQAADVLLFLHADTRLPPDGDRLLLRTLANSDRCWGRFDVSIDSTRPLLRVVETLMNWRSRLTGIATGDHAIFVENGTFIALEGFAPIDLMEDIDFSRRARRISPPLALRARVLTSGRRWERHGVLRTIFLMWRLRAAYFFGADPNQLAREYREAR
jgi:rSAM/selenodomain-associated transferase 2